MNDSKNIYQKRLFCSNSRSRGNLCGKLPFPLGSRRFFIHSPMWKHFRLSTGVVESSGAFKNSTAFLSTFHSPCGENSGVEIRKPPKKSASGEALRACSRNQSHPEKPLPARTAVRKRKVLVFIFRRLRGMTQNYRLALILAVMVCTFSCTVLSPFFRATSTLRMA